MLAAVLDAFVLTWIIRLLSKGSSLGWARQSERNNKALTIGVLASLSGFAADLLAIGYPQYARYALIAIPIVFSLICFLGCRFYLDLKWVKSAIIGLLAGVYKSIFLAVLVYFISAVANPTPDYPALDWKSSHSPIEVRGAGGSNKDAFINQAGDLIDQPDNLLVAFTYRNVKNTRCVIRYEKDVPLDVLPMEQYVEAMMAQFDAQPGFEVIERSEVSMFDKTFTRLLYTTRGDAAEFQTDFRLFRNGEHSVWIQSHYPPNSTNTLSDKVQRFLSSIRLEL